jgi:hypothetical protein
MGAEMDRAGTQWAPYLEWSLRNPTYDGNPFDLTAEVVFTHRESGEQRTTGMFYAGGDLWEFRFTGTRPGEWTFSTAGEDADLAGRTGAVVIEANPAGVGFVVGVGSGWARQAGVNGHPEGFVPQFVMYDGPQAYHGRPDKVDADIRTFLSGHGFNGLHTNVFCRWFDMEHERSSEIEATDPNPDPRTFEALELLIGKVYAAGGVVHVWAWGDESRRQTPIKWGINGAADRRLQRYIAARLGPIPGWTMGYGYDLFEWTKGPQLDEWHRHMHEQMGWPHMLGARSWKNSLDQISEAMDYSSYEQHRPDYTRYVETISRRPAKPSFSEDRFRIRGRAKDYTMEETRRGLWHSAMAGGVANIWGNLKEGTTEGGGSKPYPRPEWIRTYASFINPRFSLDLARDNGLTDGVCLRSPDGSRYLFYREGAGSVRMDLSGMPGSAGAVAVDTVKPYVEIDLGEMKPGVHTWQASGESDWAIAVGDFEH